MYFDVFDFVQYNRDPNNCVKKLFWFMSEVVGSLVSIELLMLKRAQKKNTDFFEMNQ